MATIRARARCEECGRQVRVDDNLIAPHGCPADGTSQHVGRRWQAIVKRDGRTWHRTGGTKAAVEAWAKAIEKDLDAGLDPDRVKTGMPTLAGWEARCRRPNRGRCS
jgi:hypothetical protein